jgi:hypothetical protein
VYAFSFAIKMEATWEIKRLDERRTISQCDVLRETGGEGVMGKRVQQNEEQG